MMRAILLTTLLALAAPAMAQDPVTTLAERPLVVEGEAPPACVVGNATATGQNIDVSSTDGGVTIGLRPEAFVDGEGFPAAGALAITVPILCNSSHQLVVTSTRQGLRSDAVGDPGNGFLNVAAYVLSLNWAGLAGRFDTSSESSVVMNVPDAAAGSATLNVNFAAGAQRLVAGTYSDELTVEVSAAY